MKIVHSAYIYNVTYMQQFGGASGKVNHVCNEYNNLRQRRWIDPLCSVDRPAKLWKYCSLLAFRCKRLEEVMNLVVSCTLAKFSPVQLSSGTNKFISFIGELVLDLVLLSSKLLSQLYDRGNFPVATVMTRNKFNVFTRDYHNHALTFSNT